MKQPSVAIVILNFNGIEDTRVCLKSFDLETYPNYTLIVVDNHSADDSVRCIRSEFPAVTLLESSANLGFSGGNNIGIRHAFEQNFDYIMLLNNDTLLQGPFLQFLVDAMEKDQKLAAISPLLYLGESTEIWFGGAKVDYQHGTAVHVNSQFQNQTEPYSVEWLTGCAPFIRTSILKKLNGLDERYFLYWEDVDFSLSLRDLGYSLAIEPNARIHHLCGRSASKLRGQSVYYYTRNHLLFAKTHMAKHPGTLRRVFKSNLRRSVREVLKSMIKRDFQVAYREFRWGTLAFVDHYRGRYGKREA